jgi:hypothetical protein
MSEDSQRAYEKALAVKRAQEAGLMKRANVVGVGVGLRQKSGMRTGEVAVVVMVRRKLPLAQLSPRDVLPTEIDGVPVDVQEAGDLRAHD